MSEQTDPNTPPSPHNPAQEPTTPPSQPAPPVESPAEVEQPEPNTGGDGSADEGQTQPNE